MVTSEPVRDRIVPFTRSMSAAKNPIRRAMEGGEGFSNGTMTAKGSLRDEGRATIETLWWAGKSAGGGNAMVGGQVRRWWLCTQVFVRCKNHVAPRMRWVNVPQSGWPMQVVKESVC